MKILLQKIKKHLSKKNEKGHFRLIESKDNFSLVSCRLVSFNPCEKCKNYAPLEPEKEVSGCPI